MEFAGVENKDGGKLRVIIAEASPVANAALESELGGLNGAEVVARATNSTQLMSLVNTMSPDLVILSLNIEGDDAFEAFGAIRLVQPELSVLVFDTMFRVGDVPNEDDFEVGFMASYVVATQLVPRVRALFGKVPGQENSNC